jgi:hypothetical protein
MQVAENPLDVFWPSRRILPALHVQDAMERSKADHAKADRHAALHADRAWLQAELDRARAELAMAQRPWLRQLVGGNTLSGGYRFVKQKYQALFMLEFM